MYGHTKINSRRPPWDLPSGTKFVEANDMAHATLILQKIAKRVLVTTGHGDLDKLQKLTNIQFFIRVIEKKLTRQLLQRILLLLLAVHPTA